jgi:hypothetical protein
MIHHPPGTSVSPSMLPWQALHHLSLESAKSVHQLADEAVRDLLKKYRRPITLREALKESLRMQPANDHPRDQRAVARSK